MDLENTNKGMYDNEKEKERKEEREREGRRTCEDFFKVDSFPVKLGGSFFLEKEFLWSHERHAHIECKFSSLHVRRGKEGKKKGEGREGEKSIDEELEGGTRKRKPVRTAEVLFRAFDSPCSISNIKT